MCSLVDTLLVDHEAVYSPRLPNDRLLLGLKGSLSEYELDLLRQRSLEARRAKAKRGELVLDAPIGYIKTPDQRLELHPDRRVRRVYEKIQRMLKDNVSNFGLGRRAACRQGSALLVGLLLCRRCGRKLLVGYTGREASTRAFVVTWTRESQHASRSAECQ